MINLFKKLFTRKEEPFSKKIMREAEAVAYREFRAIPYQTIALYGDEWPSTYFRRAFKKVFLKGVKCGRQAATSQPEDLEGAK